MIRLLITMIFVKPISNIAPLSVGIDSKELGGSDVEMFEILPRD